MTAEIGHYTDDGTIAEVDLEIMTGYNTGIIGAPGAGKSGTARVMIEAAQQEMQVIVLDDQDEFFTLREKMDFIIAGGDDADIPISVDGAAKLAIGLLELGASAIIQLNDMEDKREFADAFLRAFADAPKELWHPVLIFIDEMQVYAPLKGEVASSGGVRRFATTGRKRGFSLMFASPRLSLVDTDVRGSMNNWLFGKVGQSLDRRAVADELGLGPTSTEAKGLHSLEQRRFWASGPAFNASGPRLLEVNKATTTIVKHGQQAGIHRAPAPEALRAALEALRPAPAPAPPPTPASPASTQQPAGAIVIEHKGGKISYAGKTWFNDEAVMRAALEAHSKGVDQVRGWVTGELQDLLARMETQRGKTVEEASTPAPPPPPPPPPSSDVVQAVAERIEALGGDDKPLTKAQAAAIEAAKTGKFRSQTMALIHFLQSIYPRAATLEFAAKHAGVGSVSSQWPLYVAEIPLTGLVEPIGDKWRANIQSGSPHDTLGRVKAGLTPAERRIFEAIINSSPRPITKEEIVELAKISPTSSTTDATLRMLMNEAQVVEKTRAGYMLVESFR